MWIQLSEYERLISSLDGIRFEEMIHELISNVFNSRIKNIEHPGKVNGKTKPAHSKEDIWISYSEDGVLKHLFIAMTNQQANVFSKMENDINKLLTYIKKTECEHPKILYVVPATIKFEKVSDIRKKCENQHCEFELWGIDTIIFNLEKYGKNIADKYLGIKIHSFGMEDIGAFTSKKHMEIDIEKSFLFRDVDKNNVIRILLDKRSICIFGKSGCGKTRLAIETAYELHKKHSFSAYFLTLSNTDVLEGLNNIAEHDNKVIIVVDDYNKFKEINRVLNFLKVNDNIYIILTIRDYLFETYKEDFEYDFGEYKLQCLTNEQIKEIIIKDYNITNNNALNYILDVSSGNLRVAILVAKYLLNGDITANSISDVIDCYCIKILNEINKKEDFDFLKFISSVSFFQIINLNDIKKFKQICSIFHFDIDVFKAYLAIANENELVNFLSDKNIVSNNSQILSDYANYKIIFEYGLVDIIEIYKVFGINDKRKFYEMVYSVFNIYFDKNTILPKILMLFNYIKSNENNNETIDFLSRYCEFLPEEAIDYASKYLVEYDGVVNPVSEYRYSTPIYLTATNVVFHFFEYDNFYIHVINVIFDIYERKNNLRETILYCINNKAKIKRDSFSRNYKSQILLLKKAIQNGFDLELYKTILDTYYGFYSEESEMSGDNKLTFYHLTNLKTDNYLEYRELIFQIVDELFERKELFNCENTLRKNTFKQSENYELRKIDFEIVSKLLDKVDYSSIHNKIVCISILSPFYKFSEAKKYLSKIYDSYLMELYRDYIDELTSIKKFGDKLNPEIKNSFSNHDVIETLNCICELEILFGEKYYWKVMTLLDVLFEDILKNNADKYNFYLITYLKKNSQTSLQLINLFEKSNNKQELFSVISKDYNLSNNPSVVSPLLLSIKLKDINEEICNYCFSFFTSDLFIEKDKKWGNECIVSLLEYEKYRKNFLYNLLIFYKNNDLLLSNFISGVFVYYDDFQYIVNLFGGDEATIIDLFFIQFEKGHSLDSKSNLISYVGLINNDFLMKIIKIAVNNKSDYYSIRILFENPNFIAVFLNYLVETKLAYNSFSVSLLVSKFNDDLFERFLREAIHRFVYNEKMLLGISYIVQERGKESRLLFLKMCISEGVEPDILNNLDLMSGPKSWSGRLSDYLKEDIELLKEYIASHNYLPKYNSILLKILDRLTKRLKDEEIFELDNEI